MLIDAGGWLAAYGLGGLAAVITAETGLLVGVVLPAETMLVLAGAYTNPSADGAAPLPFVAVVAVAAAAAAAGGMLGYLIGRRAGPSLFRRPDARPFKQGYLLRTQAYFRRYGRRTVILARFMPVIRTLASPAAGAAQMPAAEFAAVNAVGAGVWAASVAAAGHLLGEVVPVDRYLLPLIAAVAAVSLTPLLWEWRTARRRATAGAPGTTH